MTGGAPRARRVRDRRTAGQHDWTSLQTLGLLALSAVLVVVFLVIESRVHSPLVPLRLFALRNLAVANGSQCCADPAAVFAWFFLS